MNATSTTPDRSPLDQPIGIIGLGVMGSTIAARLHRTGHRVIAYDANPNQIAKVQQDSAASIEAAQSPQEVASQTSIIILSLNTAAIVRSVAQNVFSVNANDALIIDMSSIDPGTTRELADEARGKNIGWVDSPLSGGAPKASTGELTLMLGGTPEAVARARTVLQYLATRTTHCGPSGSGQAVKAINQLIVGSAFTALSEAAALTRSQNLEPKAVLDALTGGRADSPVFQEFFLKFAKADPEPTGRISNMLKDLETVLELGRQTTTPLPMSSAITELHRWLVSHGLGNADSASMGVFYDAELDDGRWL